MYGLVNQAIQEMVIEKFGDDTWEKIRDKASCDDIFIGMDQYSDQITLDLVGAACEILGADAATILKTFGEYWVGFTGEAYGSLFEMSGNTFVELVRNLNTLHTRVASIMPDLKPPSFTVTDETDDSFILQYHSSRPGLYPMIEGLMTGLGARFNTNVEVKHLRGTDDGIDYDEFKINYSAK